MVIKSYSLSLDSDIVEAARKKVLSESKGAKLSPIINDLLKTWVNKDTKKSNK